MAETQLYPLVLERRLDSRLWGGNRMGAWLGLERYPERLAESWQVYDENKVLNGPLAGQSLAQLTASYGERLTGSRSAARYGADFPLLAKFIDAADSLSVQVHPDDAYAHAHEAASGFHGKTEAWYILNAPADASLIYGLRRGVSREEFAQAISANSLPELLGRIPVAAGDVVFVPAGTVHAVEPGIMLFEIQQKSDLTYRIYDYDRRDDHGRPRELHVAKALDVSDLSGNNPPRPKPLALSGDATRVLLVACPFFAMELLSYVGGREQTIDPGSFEILTVVEGGGRLSWPGGELSLERGQSLVLPASLGSYQLAGSPGPLVALRCYVPDLDALRAEALAQSASEAAMALTIHDLTQR